MWWRLGVVERCRKSDFAASGGAMVLVEALKGESWAVLTADALGLARLRSGGCKIAGVLR